MTQRDRTISPKDALPVLLALSLLISSCAARAAYQAPQRILAPLPTATRAPTATPSPVSQAALNAEQGCAPDAPKPYPGIAWEGRTPGPGAAPNEVALTFDDGPAPTTPPFLDLLEQTHTQATFFVVGRQANRFPDLIQREWHDGFAIGVHTWDHADMTRLTQARMRTELETTLQTLHAILGADACIWLWRPPYGAVNDLVRRTAASYGLTTVTWSEDGVDWTRPGAAKIATRILNAARPGAIVLMHDGPANRQQTLDALPTILAGLKARGLKPVTLPRLLADAGYPGVHVPPDHRSAGAGLSHAHR